MYKKFLDVIHLPIHLQKKYMLCLIQPHRTPEKQGTCGDLKEHAKFFW